MEDTTSTRRSSGVGDHDVCNPCSFLRKAVSAMLKCLGFDEAKPYVDDHGNKSSSCSKEKDEEKFNNERNDCSGQDDQSSYSPLDPPSSMDPADDPPMEDLAGRGRTPPRPGIRTGNPQTNSSFS
ncbi:uncharacterized protein LOC113750195 [Coffea eugenioides]|uniref:uncharacterized protein LOC113750195 n=1 Tax=Coffea eugenioides TaxID=49369 RepID=UPI000F6113EC|nr:uncharacterized protein LOC113750195 [Coffea eugenioides]